MGDHDRYYRLDAGLLQKKEVALEICVYALMGEGICEGKKEIKDDTWI